jgi:hypothetical protein
MSYSEQPSKPDVDTLTARMQRVDVFFASPSSLSEARPEELEIAIRYLDALLQQLKGFEDDDSTHIDASQCLARYALLIHCIHV